MKFFLAALLLLSSIVTADPTTRESRLTIARGLWEQRLNAAGGKPIVSEYYPTEEALVFLTAYDFTRDARYSAQAVAQLEYSHSRERDGIFLTSDGTTTRDYQARQIYNFYLAYRILGDGRYLRWADAGATAMIRVIPRGPHEAAGETHTTFLAGFITGDGKPARSTGQVIDVNQNAEVALAYSLLYHDPASQFFQDPRAKEIAYEELLASMSVQNLSTGEIPLTENIAGPDTLYGSYAAFSWVWCQLLWREEKFEPHLRAAGKWLAPKMNLKTDTQRWYPTRIDGGVVSYSEAYFRLPLLWYCQIDCKKFIADLFARMPDAQATPHEKSTAPQYWAYYDLMAIARDYFLDGNPSASRRAEPGNR
jgi:hypothetical protein